MTEPAAPSVTQRVTVTDIDMPFRSMVNFMVKWVLAAIPALLILAVLGAVLAGLISAFTGELSR